MSRIFSTFIFGMATMTVIAFSMKAFGMKVEDQATKVPADCRVTAYANRGNVIYDSGAVREQLGQEPAFLFSDKQRREMAHATYFSMWIRASVGQELRLALHFGKNETIAGFDHNMALAATGHPAGPVAVTHRMSNGTVLKMECVVVK